MRLDELAKKIGGELLGAGDIEVTAIKDIGEAKTKDLAFLLDAKNAEFLERTDAGCVVVPLGIKKARPPIIRCKNVAIAFKQAVEAIFPARIPAPKGIDKTAVISPKARLGKNVAIGANCVIEEGAEIGDNVVIHPLCYVGHFTKIGGNSILYPNVTVREKITIGARVIIHPGAVIGADGFGYTMVGLIHEKIPQIGDVIIEDDVEIGACTAIDRAKIAHTRIGKGTKIDNLVQIGHNCIIGENCIIVGQVGLSGSVKLGNNVMLGGQVGVADHIELGDFVMVGAQSGVSKNFPPKSIIMGVIPPMEMHRHRRRVGHINMLDKLFKRVKRLEKEVEDLKAPQKG